MIMAEPPITQPAQAPLPPLSARRRRAAAPSSTVTLARLSCLTGILFAALFVLALVFVYTTPHLSASDADITAFYDGGSTVLVTVGQVLVPLAGIAFLWHAHTTRLLIESRTPSPSAIPYGLQLVSGDPLRCPALRRDGIGRLSGAVEGSDGCAATVGRRCPGPARTRLRNDLHLLHPRRRACTR